MNVSGIRKDQQQPAVSLQVAKPGSRSSHFISSVLLSGPEEIYRVVVLYKATPSG